MPMLIFDFDGVLIDSIDEVTVTAYNGVTENRATALDQLPEDLVALFRRNRFHAQGAPDVFTLMDWCLKHDSGNRNKLLSRDEFQAILAEDDRPAEALRERFFETRRRFVEENKAAWLALNTPYQPLWKAIVQRGGDRVILLTTKNGSAARSLCHHFGLPIPAENIYAGDGGTTKIDNMNRIHARFEQKSYTFIDDNLKNLRQLDTRFNRNEAFLHLLMASWGYVGPDDRDHARKAGYSYITQTDLIDRLDEELPA